MRIGNAGGGVLFSLHILSGGLASDGLVDSISRETLKGLIWWPISDAILDAIEEPIRITIESNAQKS